MAKISAYIQEGEKLSLFGLSTPPLIRPSNKIDRITNAMRHVNINGHFLYVTGILIGIGYKRLF